MKIAILGGGLTGLTAAYHLSKKGHTVVVYEGAERLGGLAQGFHREGWEWELERTYHHIFNNDHEILNLAHEIGYFGFKFKTPLTASLFGEVNNYRIFPVDSPKDFLLLPELSLIAKLRAGVTLVFLKLSPFLPFYEKITSSSFLRMTMGNEVWKVLWEQLFRKKFGIFAEKILASFIWARVTKRTQSLGYPDGGFQTFIDALAVKDKELGVAINKSSIITEIHKTGNGYEVVGKKEGSDFCEAVDTIISTLPYPTTLKVMSDLLGEEYCAKQRKRKYLFAINLILKTDKPLLNTAYWLNVGAKDIPFMCVVQHTNFVDKKHYENKHIAYIAWYVEGSSDLMKKNEEEMLAFVLPYLKNMQPNLTADPEVVALIKAPYAQPIFDAEFTTIPRTFTTREKRILIANLDMTYPYDRGTNYAVQLGKEVSNYFLNQP
ncbi:MAG: FAD-dependent oxidoreductase [Microgenomates group bacterium]